MPPKRALGLGQAARAKKSKLSTVSHAESDLITVDLSEEVAANDTMAQLKALWRNFIDSSDRSELMLNGIIHECDRILRKVHNSNAGQSGETGSGHTTEKGKASAVENEQSQEGAQATEEASNEDINDKDTAKDLGENKQDTTTETEVQGNGSHQAEKVQADTQVVDEEIVLTGDFYGIYGLALSMLGFFHTEEPHKVKEFFKEAQDRISTGFEKFPNSIALKFAHARILINRIPLLEVSAMTLDSRKSLDTKDLSLLLDECLSVWEEAEKAAELQEAYEYFSLENSDFLQALDDLLDMVDNFGQEKLHGAKSDDKGSDNEDDDDDDHEQVVLNSSHPLFSIVQNDKYNVWWRDHTVRFLHNLNRKIDKELHDSKVPANRAHDLTLRRELSKRLGQSYLMEAEAPSNIYTTLAYFEKDKKSLNGMTLHEAREATQKLLLTALDYLKVAQDEEEPDSWAAVAEAMISLGNTYDLDSEIQEKTYQEAEKLLTRANNATNGRYSKVLENLTQAD